MPVKRMPIIASIANELPFPAPQPPPSVPPYEITSPDTQCMVVMQSTKVRSRNTVPIDSIQYACQSTFGGRFIADFVLVGNAFAQSKILLQTRKSLKRGACNYFRVTPAGNVICRLPQACDPRTGWRSGSAPVSSGGSAWSIFGRPRESPCRRSSRRTLRWDTSCGSA